MSSWNVVQKDDEEFMLLNESQTMIVKSRSAFVDIAVVLTQLEEAGVPSSYTKGLELIKFTRLQGVDGHYVGNEIHVHTSRAISDNYARVITHELAHHLDDQEDIVSDEKLKREKMFRAKKIPDPYAKKNVGEYLAVGFEFFYFGSKKEKRELRKNNPVLYRKILNLHRKYGKM